ncbi:sugar phosphate isomerase/epimerase family protein [Ensifer sp. SSB1]|jgi:sugar phosphate isomerase/epimerase|uniref:sugar phosphate isomerase/epimerase family protein n=1 Tax=Ensifer sp. SSB1 TaxID=2795385 RepID=UPI001A3697E0|nr:sugar phosphate isomerase/epimerase family protein [Ensifer sp. SSB1]MBK5570236.1 TIM barrel protein [Ensifer sp. SSB1]
MTSAGVKGIGISAHRRAADLSDFGAELDMIEALGVDSIEIPTFDLDVVVGGRVRRPQLAALLNACRGRDVLYSVHGPLAINFMDEAWRLPRHFEVLEASLEVAAEIGAEHYVMHSGLALRQQAAGTEAAYERQRHALSNAGDLARQHGLILCVETLFADFKGDGYASSPSRLATELAAIAHNNVMATIDFSHSYLKLDFDGNRDGFVAEIAALAPYAKHLHVHDSFGRQDDIWMYTEGERLAYGHGDLHLPVGWGDMPWQALMAECIFPEGVLFNIELNQRYWYAAQECIEATRGLARSARIGRTAAAA